MILSDHLWIDRMSNLLPRYFAVESSDKFRF